MRSEGQLIIVRLNQLSNIQREKPAKGKAVPVHATKT